MVELIYAWFEAFGLVSLLEVLFVGFIVLDRLLSSTLVPHSQMYPIVTLAYITTLHKLVRLGLISMLSAGE